MTIFWVWKNVDTDPRPVVSTFGAAWWPYDGMGFGIVDGDAATRHSMIDVGGDLVVLPGVNGKLTDEQATAVSPAFTAAKAGDSMYDVLAAIYAATSIEALNPDAY